VSRNSCHPEDDRGQDHAAAVDDGLLVVAGGQAAPVLESIDGALDDVAVLVVLASKSTGRPPVEPQFCGW
jgi:hypothetical protein